MIPPETPNLNVQSFPMFTALVLDLLSVIKKEASLLSGLRDGPLVKPALESHNNNKTLSYFLDDLTCERTCFNTMRPISE